MCHVEVEVYIRKTCANTDFSSRTGYRISLSVTPMSAKTYHWLTLYIYFYPIKLGHFSLLPLIQNLSPQQIKNENERNNHKRGN